MFICTYCGCYSTTRVRVVLYCPLVEFYYLHRNVGVVQLERQYTKEHEM